MECAVRLYEALLVLSLIHIWRIVNFAYARAFTVEVVKAYLRYDRGIEYEFFPDARQLREPFPEKGGSQDPDGPIGAIVYDLDQTLIDSGIRDLRLSLIHI